MVVRRVLFAAGAAFVALTLAGCGTDEAIPARPPLPARLAQLCDETRTAVERLGEPRDKGAAVFRPWARLGREFVARVRRLRGATPQQRDRVRLLADYYAGFYDNLQLSYDLFRAGRSTAIKMTLQRAYALLSSGEKLATRMGVPECAVRPFDEE